MGACNGLQDAHPRGEAQAGNGPCKKTLVASGAAVEQYSPHLGFVPLSYSALCIVVLSHLSGLVLNLYRRISFS